MLPRSAFTALAAVATTVLALACGGSAPPPLSTTPSAPTSTSAASPTKGGGGDDPAKKAAAIDRITGEETKSGKCTADHEAALNKLLSAVETAMMSTTDDDAKHVTLSLVTKRVLVLGSSPRGIELSVTGRGTELHVLAFAVRDVSMDVLAGTTAATTLRSPHARAVQSLALDLPDVGHVTEVTGDSRQVAIKPGEPLQVKLTGRGCAGLIAFLKPS